MAEAKFDIKTEATRQFYAGVGITDLAVEKVRDYVADMQKRLSEVQKSFAEIDLEPEHLRKEASTRFESLSKEAKERRSTIEHRMHELQKEAKAFPAKVTEMVNENVTQMGDTYDDLVKRGETLVMRIRKQESTKEAVKSAKTTVTKAKTTRTQAAKASHAAEKAAEEQVKTARATAKKKTAASRSSAKATVTAARKTAVSTAHAVVEAVEKVGDEGTGHAPTAKAAG